MGRFRSAVIVLAALLAGVSAAHAQVKYPTKPIKIIVPVPPGNAADLLARTLGDHVGKQLNTTIVVDNRPGADAKLGASLAAAAPGDGYTLFIASPSSVSAALALFAKINYDPLKDFVPITMLTVTSSLILVKSDSPANTVAEFIALAKAQPGRLTYASGNATTRIHAELFQAMAGIKMTHVPYTGIDQALQDLQNGQVTMMINGSLSSSAWIQRNAVKILGVTTKNRTPEMPNVPTVNETVPGYFTGGWQAIVASKGTPPEIVAILNAAFHKALADPAIVTALTKSGGTEIMPTTPEELGKWMENDVEVWRKIVRDTNMPVAKE